MLQTYFFMLCTAVSRVKKWEITRKKRRDFFRLINHENWLMLIKIVDIRTHFNVYILKKRLRISTLKNKFFGSLLKVKKILSLKFEIISPPSHIVLLSFCLKTAVNIWFIHFPILKLSFLIFPLTCYLSFIKMFSMSEAKYK